MNHNQIIEAWNAQADEHNQWGALGEDEKVGFAFSLGAGNLDRANALLRQALEALEKTRAFHQQDWSSEEITPKLTRGTITAIKQHLGEV